MSLFPPSTGLGLYISYSILFGLGLLLFLLRISEDPVKSRYRVLVILQSVSGFMFYTVARFALPGESGRCEVHVFLLVLGVPLLAMPYIYRALKLWYTSSLNRKTQLVNKPDEDELSKMFPTSKPLSPRNWIMSNRWMLDIGFELAIFVAYPILFLVILLPVFYFPQQSIQQEDCHVVYSILIAIQTFILTALTIFLAFVLRKFRDAYYIKLELQLVTIFGLPLLILASVLYFFPTRLPEWLSGENVTILFTCFSLLFSVYLPALLSLPLVISFIHSETLRPHGSLLDVSGKGGDFFFHCLQDERLSKSFEEFCVESFAAENLFFYRHAVAYRTLQGEFMKTEAYRMRHEYVSQESVFEIELNPKIKERILKRIEDAEIDETLFLEAEQEIYLHMRQSIYPHWKRSDAFKELARGGLRRSKKFMRGSQFVTPVDMQVFENEKARRRSMEMDDGFEVPKSMPPSTKPEVPREKKARLAPMESTEDQGATAGLESTNEVAEGPNRTAEGTPEPTTTKETPAAAEILEESVRKISEPEPSTEAGNVKEEGVISGSNEEEETPRSLTSSSPTSDREGDDLISKDS